MKITRRTRTTDILPLVNKDNVEDLLSQFPPYPLKKPVSSMTIEEFSQILGDEEGFITKLLSHKKALVAFGRLKQYRDEISGISKFMKLYDHRRSQEEEQAAKGIVFPDMSMRMLADCVRFFGLKSFKEAERCTVSDWLAIFQLEASATLYQLNYNRIMANKQKNKQKQQ